MKLQMRATGTLCMSIMFTCVLIFSATSYADDNESEGHGASGRNWVLLIGGGAEVHPKYIGADEVEISPIPAIIARYNTQYIDFFIDVEQGAGLSFKLPQYTSASLSTGINLGRGRSNTAMSVLRRTAELEMSYLLFGRLDIPLPLGTLGAQLSYIPISADYDEAEFKDKDYDGILTEFGWDVEFWLRENLRLGTGIGMSFANDDYAKAVYGVEYETERLKKFDPIHGMQNLDMSLELIYMFNQRFGTAMMTEISYLVGDAADSPLTRQEVQPFGGLFMFYNF